MYFDTWGRSQINVASMDDIRKFLQTTLEKISLNDGMASKTRSSKQEN